MLFFNTHRWDIGLHGLWSTPAQNNVATVWSGAGQPTADGTDYSVKLCDDGWCCTLANIGPQQFFEIQTLLGQWLQSRGPQSCLCLPSFQRKWNHLESDRECEIRWGEAESVQIFAQLEIAVGLSIKTTGKSSAHAAYKKRFFALLSKIIYRPLVALTDFDSQANSLDGNKKGNGWSICGCSALYISAICRCKIQARS